jgi:hypothetical protein
MCDLRHAEGFRTADSKQTQQACPIPKKTKIYHGGTETRRKSKKLIPINGGCFPCFP